MHRFGAEAPKITRGEAGMKDLLTLDRPLIVLDCETTGLDVQAARIVELGFQLFEGAFPGDGPKKEWRSLVNPGVPIPADATKVHHLTDVDVTGCRVCDRPRALHLQPPVGTIGNPTQECSGFRPWPAFAQLASNLAKGFSDCDFAGKNVRYDLRVLSAEFARAGVAWSCVDARILDVDRLEQLGEPRHLSDLYRKHVGRELDGAHQALADVRATTEVIAAQLTKYAKLPRDLRRLHELQWPGWIDSEGKFRFVGSVPCFSQWGKYAGRPMREADVGYWDFILSKDFSADVKALASAAKLGEYPVAP